MIKTNIVKIRAIDDPVFCVFVRHDVDAQIGMLAYAICKGKKGLFPNL